MEKQELLFEILAGTYEEFTVGYKCIRYGDEVQIKHTIATHAHTASIKSIAVLNVGPYDILVTGGTDENIHLYDLRRRKESGLLTNHSGTVTCLRFTPDGSHLITASEDGSISVIKVGSWFVEKLWTKPHKGLGVVHLSVHPSGKLALSLGADKTLRTWNLVKGRPAYTINLSGKVQRPELVEWSLCGEYYGLVNENELNLYLVETAGIANTFQSQSRITCICFLPNERVCIGDWNGNLTCYLYKKGEKEWEIKGEVRLKVIQFCNKYLVSVTGEGVINVYDIENETPKKKASYETNSRITCIAISKLLSEEERLTKKRKKKSKDFQSPKTEIESDLQQPSEKDASEEQKELLYLPCSHQKWTVAPLTTSS